ncbi:MAG TPA: sugar ABC transporter ATP-binding protein [Stenotrophomonas sp.]|nr:sugar ABC transporter ATP-binding protein [Stenotrophomonas sp.]
MLLPLEPPPAVAACLHPLLQAEGVTKRYGGVLALRDGRLHLAAGRVHALCGGNGAGKSTFLGILMGLLRRDAGSVRLLGREMEFASPAEARQHGLAIITQELSPVLALSVAENLFLGRAPRRARWWVDAAAQRRQAQAVLDRLGFAIDARAPMHTLSLAQMQLVEIARAFSQDCRVIVMDEPTSAIGERETRMLFDAIRAAAAQGTGIIYVSHRLGELFEIADDYTLFRDGAYVESGVMADISHAQLVRRIAGDTPARIALRRPASAVATPCLEVTGLHRRGEFGPLDLQLRKGEILGLYGLMGSGRSELLNCLYGLTTADAGAVRVRGRALRPGHPAAALASGMALVTEDRKQTGLLLQASTAENIALPVYRRLSWAGLVRWRPLRAQLATMARRMRLRATALPLPVAALSGGNQQKVVLAKCLIGRPRLLLCDEPTRGIDEGAKQEIHALLERFAAEGNAVLLVSSEAPELLRLSDRVLVLRGGRVVADCAAADTDAQRLLQLASSLS